MKQVYFLFIFFLSAMAVQAQQPVITLIADATCPGGTPKMVEIYAQGTVDFTQYSVEIQSNANMGSWAATTDLSMFGTKTNEFVYITTGSSAANFATEFPNVPASNILETGAANFNGDDRFRLIETSSMNVIDQYGVTDVRGTGEPWEYTNSYANRVDGTGPDGGFTISNWNINPTNSLNGAGDCNGASPLDNVIGIGTFSGQASTDPVISITSPFDGESFSSGDVTISLSVSNFNVAQSGGDGYIQYQLDSNTIVDKFDTTDIQLSNVSPGSHVISVELVDNSGTPLNPPATDNVTFDVLQTIQVNDIISLRQAGASSQDVFEITDEVIVTYSQRGSFRGQFFIQDSSAAILVDDNDSNISNAIGQGDGITGLTGTLSEFNGQLQFVPTENQMANITSSNNTISPEQVTIAMLNNNPEAYESELVTLSNVSFDMADGVLTFINNEELVISNGADTFTFRNSFFDADYSGDAQGDGDVVPVAATNITGIITERDNGSYFITARNRGDIDALSTGEVRTATIDIYPNPATGGKLFISGDLSGKINVAIYSALGQQVLKKSDAPNQIDISSLDTGVYFVKITAGTKAATKKLIVK